jgi:restriction system protein
VVTSGRFTDEATAFASGRNVRLVGGTQLHGLIREAKANLTSRPAPAAPIEPTPAQEHTGSASPQCPTCGKAMVRRTAKRGATAGREFWGCEGYPGCRGTRPMQ